jgi:hypothetical protein
LFPKFPLLSDLALVESSGSCSSHEFLTLLRVARRYGPRRPDGVAEPHPAVLNALGVRFLLSPEAFRPPRSKPLGSSEADAAPANAKLWLNPRAFPRAWIVHEVVAVPALTGSDPDQCERLTQEVFFPGNRPRNLRRTAVVEGGEPRAESGGQSAESEEQRAESGGRKAESGERCNVVWAGTQRVEVDAELKTPGLVVVSDLFYPGWVAHVTSADGQSRPVPILRTNRIMRGVEVPAGKHKIEFVFRPVLFYAGATISALGWLALVGCWGYRRLV